MKLYEPLLRLMIISNLDVVTLYGMTRLVVNISLLIYSNVATFDLIILLFGKEVRLMGFSPTQAIVLAHINLDSLHDTMMVL